MFWGVTNVLDEPTRYCNPEDHSPNFHSHRNLKFHMSDISVNGNEGHLSTEYKTSITNNEP